MRPTECYQHPVGRLAVATCKEAAMTTDQPSPSLPTVQTRKRGGKLKPKACPPRRITYRSILKELKGKPKGRLPSEAQLEALHGSSDQAAFWLNCDAPVERLRSGFPTTCCPAAIGT